jgi:2-C-methyl-D-erythritol 2,4-cyclodiphosphate synthase
MSLKIGIGSDIHRLVPGRRLVLGGIEIAHDRGLLGHSDADVVIHAIADAILGALALPNIGEMFPDTAAWTKDLDSKKILARVVEKLEKGGYAIANVDAVIIAEAPKLSPHLDAMRHSLAEILKIQPIAVGLKATTNDGLGSIGRGEGIATMATVLLVFESVK